MNKKIGLIISNNIFRDEEYFLPKQILENSGIEVITIAEKLKICTGKLGSGVMPDMKIVTVDTNNFDGIVFIGGSGSKDYWHNETAHKIAQNIFESGKVIAAICSSVATLAFAGILKGKNTNSFTTERKILKEYGAILSDEDCVVDGNLITANGPKAAKQFGEEILNKLKMQN